MTLAQTRYLDTEMSKWLQHCKFMDYDEAKTIDVIRGNMLHAYEQVREAIRLKINDPAHLN